MSKNNNAFIKGSMELREKFTCQLESIIQGDDVQLEKQSFWDEFFVVPINWKTLDKLFLEYQWQHVEGELVLPKSFALLLAQCVSYMAEYRFPQSMNAISLMSRILTIWTSDQGRSAKDIHDLLSLNDAINPKKLFQGLSILLRDELSKGCRDASIKVFILLLSLDPSPKTNPFLANMLEANEKENGNNVLFKEVYGASLQNLSDYGTIILIYLRYAVGSSTNEILRLISEEKDCVIFQCWTDQVTNSLSDLLLLLQQESDYGESIWLRMGLVSSDIKARISNAVNLSSKLSVSIVFFLNLILYNVNYVDYILPINEISSGFKSNLLFENLILLTLKLIIRQTTTIPSSSKYQDLTELCLSVMRCLYEIPSFALFLNQTGPLHPKSFPNNVILTSTYSHHIVHALGSIGKFDLGCMVQGLTLMSRILRSLKRLASDAPLQQFWPWTNICSHWFACLESEEDLKSKNKDVVELVCFNLCYLLINGKFLLSRVDQFIELLELILDKGKLIRSLCYKVFPGGKLSHKTSLRTFQSVFEINVYNLALIVEYFEAKIGDEERWRGQPGTRISTKDRREIIKKRMSSLELQMNPSLNLESFIGRFEESPPKYIDLCILALLCLKRVCMYHPN